MKEFVLEHGVPFESVNVLEDDAQELATANITAGDTLIQTMRTIIYTRLREVLGRR